MVIVNKTNLYFSFFTFHFSFIRLFIYFFLVIQEKKYIFANKKAINIRKMSKKIIHSILYFFGLENNPIEKRKQLSDTELLANDWKMVGRDIRNAMNTYNGR